MLKKVDTWRHQVRVCANKKCRTEFKPKREGQRYHSADCRNAGWKRCQKRHFLPERADVLGSVENGPFSSTKTVACKAPRKPDLGVFVRAQIAEAVERGDPNPIRFVTPDGVRGKVWLASKEDPKGELWPNGIRYSKIIGDDRHWRLNVPAASRVDREALSGRRQASPRDIWEIELSPIRGFRVRLGIEAEKELQVLGCGWRIVTCQFRGDKVLLHHNGNVATMKRKAFKDIVAATKAANERLSGGRIFGQDLWEEAA